MLLDPDLSREAARELARAELSKREYQEAEPSLLVRLVSRALESLSELFDKASGNVPAGRAGLIVVLLVLGGLVALLVVRLRPATGGGRSGAVFAGERTRTAGEHRAEAEALAARGAFAEAVRERLRAVVRDLEARGVLDPRPGRTADEVALEAGRLVPSLDAPLRRAARTFDEVWYGGRPADEASYRVLVEVDDTVVATRMVLA